MNDNSVASSTRLLYAFRYQYAQFQELLSSVQSHAMDSYTLSKIEEDLIEFLALIERHSNIFGEEEFATLTNSARHMQHDVHLEYQHSLVHSHHGHPEVITYQPTGIRGRPRIVIDRRFLEWAHTQRTTSGIAQFLGVSRQVVRNHLLSYGLAAPGQSPFWESEQSVETALLLGADDLISSDSESLATNDPQTVQYAIPPIANIQTGNRTDISDIDLDNLLLQLRTSFHHAGITMLEGMLRRLDVRIPRARISDSLARIDPVQRVFQRIRIRRRGYSVPGPNALWHHDGQHGLIRWGIVIHGFIDGYSRLITGLRASNNNLAETVLDVFIEAAQRYGVPARLRGDHGVENLAVAAFMQSRPGALRGSYIWGRSVHNIRIERLWVDVTIQVGASWHDKLTDLELHGGLDIHNPNHISILHYFFLPIINNHLTFFAEAWNQHRIQIRDGPNRSPADMFGFDMLVHGVRGDELINDEELEVYGVDWEALHDDDLLDSRTANNRNTEGHSSWLQSGQPPPTHLNEVPVFAPDSALEEQQIVLVEQIVEEAAATQGLETDHIALWTTVLLAARSLRPSLF